MCIFKKSDELNILYNNIFYRNIYLLRLLFFIIFLLALALNFQFEKILSQNEKINTIVSFMNSGLCFLDAHMKVEFINKKFCELLGYQYQELIGRDIHEIFCEPSKKDCVLYEDLKKKGKFEGEIIVNKKKW
ncbi:MAG: PAS domain-containing protein [Endomicrobia bacterium]|nr:PAS domain-containing protein [Endomicrobiia bacterium]